MPSLSAPTIRIDWAASTVAVALRQTVEGSRSDQSVGSGGHTGEEGGRVKMPYQLAAKLITIRTTVRPELPDRVKEGERAEGLKPIL